MTRWNSSFRWAERDGGLSPAPDRDASALDRGVHLVEQTAAIRQPEVLGQVAIGLLARGAVERHVEGDQPRAVVVSTVARPPGRRLVGRVGQNLASGRPGDAGGLLERLGGTRNRRRSLLDGRRLLGGGVLGRRSRVR